MLRNMLRNRQVLSTLIGLLILVAVTFGFYQIYNINRIHVITIAAGSITNDTHRFADELAKVVAEAEPNIKLVVVETHGSTESAQQVQSGEVDLGIVQIDNESDSQVRLIALLYPEVFHLVVHADSTIQTPADLKGKVVATSEDILPEVLAYYNIPEDAVKLLKFEESEDVHAAFVSGEADAVFRWSEPGSDRVAKLVQEGQGRLIPFSQFESMRLTAPYLAEFTIPPGLYQAGNPMIPPNNLKTVGSYKALVANTNMETMLVRTITRILFEYQNTLVARVPLVIYLRSPANIQMVGPALHPGAQEFYDKDKPTFFQQYANEISFVFAAAPILASIFLAAWAKIQRKYQTRAKWHIQAVQNALIRLTEARDVQNADVVEQRLLKILAQFTKDLNEGNIDSEDAQTFSLVWDKAITMTRDRLRYASSSQSFNPSAQS